MCSRRRSLPVERGLLNSCHGYTWVMLWYLSCSIVIDRASVTLKFGRIVHHTLAITSAWMFSLLRLLFADRADRRVRSACL